MKCPNCGYWNRDSFPQCFKCGQKLQAPQAQQTAGGSLDEFLQKNSAPKNYIRFDEEGNASGEQDARDELASEMRLLQQRKARGKRRQQQLRTDGASQGFAPTARSIVYSPERVRPNQYAQQYEYVPENEVEGELRPNARQVFSERAARETESYDGLEQSLYYSNGTTRHVSIPPSTPVRMTRTFIPGRIVRILALVLLLAAGLFAGYHYLYLPYSNTHQQEPLSARVEITPSILGDSAAHTIKIPGEEGAEIYIKELRRTYIVTGGYATIEVADYFWYENDSANIDEDVYATITPYLKTSGGEQILMEQFQYPVEVPESPLILVRPDTGYAEVSTAIYNIQFRVEKSSTVTINGEDFSDLANTQDGLISYNATIQPIGYNTFEIKTRCQYYRESTTTVTIYRAVQDIPLDLSTTLDNRSSRDEMTISATTLPGATVTVETPYKDLDISQLNTTGEFSFKALFSVIGNNTITITASYPGKVTSTVNYDVYYIPPAATYTRKAWPLDNWNYNELLSSIATRAANSQIYVCTGEIVSIISTSPQLAIMETGTSTTSRQVLLENRSMDTWVIGQRYRVYADVFGLYNGIPRLIGRYTYSP